MGKAKSKSMPKEGKDPAGGLTVVGREFFARKEGAHLRPGFGARRTRQRRWCEKDDFCGGTSLTRVGP